LENERVMFFDGRSPMADDRWPKFRCWLPASQKILNTGLV